MREQVCQVPPLPGLHRDTNLNSNLEQLLAAEQVLLIPCAEADPVLNALALKQSDINAPHPQHCQQQQQRLIVDVEQLQGVFASGVQAGHDGKS